MSSFIMKIESTNINAEDKDNIFLAFFDFNLYPFTVAIANKTPAINSQKRVTGE